MDDQALQAAIVRERQALADWLETLDEPALQTPSLCAGWAVRAVAAHLAVAVTQTVPAFLIAVVRHRGVDRAVDRAARDMARRPVADIVATFRTNATRRLTNPAGGPLGPLTDVLVHAADMRLPLGEPHAPAPELAAASLRFLTSGRAFGFVPRGRLDGLRFVATDVDSGHGEGQELRGRAIDLAVAACGRGVVLDRLEGEGVSLLRSRLAVS